MSHGWECNCGVRAWRKVITTGFMINIACRLTAGADHPRTPRPGDGAHGVKGPHMVVKGLYVGLKERLHGERTR